MRSFLAALRFLILPTNASPPTVGQPIIVLDPGPPPSIKLYSGNAHELAPGQILANNPASNPQLLIKGPDTGDGAASIFLFTQDPLADQPCIAMEADQLIFTDDDTAADLLRVIGVGSPFAGGPNIELTQFETVHAAMTAQTDFDATDRNTNTNTAFATVGAAANPGLSFVAPSSGRGWILIRVRSQINTTIAAHRTVWHAVRLGTGSTIGAGTAQAIEGITTPTEDHSLVIDNCIANGTVEANGTAAIYVSGLTAGDSFNLEMQHRLSGAGSTSYDLLHRSLQWFPIY